MSGKQRRHRAAQTAGPTDEELRADEERDAEYRRRICAELGSRVESPFEAGFELGLLRRLFEEGDRTALFECVLVCEKWNATLPIWAVRRLATGIRKYRDDPKARTLPLHSLIWGKRGAHADPYTEGHDRDAAAYTYRIVTLIKEQRQTERRAYAIASRVLRQLKIGIGEDAVKKRYLAEKARRRGKPVATDSWLPGERQLIDLVAKEVAVERSQPPNPRRRVDHR